MTNLTIMVMTVFCLGFILGFLIHGAGVRWIFKSSIKALSYHIEEYKKLKKESVDK